MLDISQFRKVFSSQDSPTPFALAAVVAVLSSIPTSAFHSQMNSNQKQGAILLLGLMWLSLIIGGGIEFIFKTWIVYIGTYLIAVFYVSFSLWVVAYRNSKIKETKKKQP